MNITAKLKVINNRFYPKHLFYAPKWIVLGVNNVCNLYCKMCDIGNKNLESNFAINLVGSRPLNMPIELSMQIIEETATHFPTAQLAYAFTEPLVYPHLLGSLIYANEKKLFTSLTTNALTLPQKAVAIAQAGLNQINISLDGLASTHNEIRGHKKSFQKAIEGIKTLNELEQSPSIHIIFAITEWNYEEIYAFASFFKGYKIASIGFMHTQFTTHEIAQNHNEIWGHLYPSTDSNLDEIDFKNIDLSVLAVQIAKVKKANFPFEVYFSPEIQKIEQLKTFYHFPEIYMGNRCHAIHQNVMIKSNGDVIPAHGRCYNLKIGNLYKNNLKEIWNSDIIKRFRMDVHKAGGLLPACTRCCSGFGK